MSLKSCVLRWDLKIGESILRMSSSRVPEARDSTAKSSKPHGSQAGRRYSETDGRGGSKGKGRWGDVKEI